MNNFNLIVAEFTKKYDLNSLGVCSSPRELIAMLLANTKCCKLADIKLGKEIITKEDIVSLDANLAEIALNKIPPQYITKRVKIYNEEYYVDLGVLIPRQDTETLIEEAIRLVSDNNYLSMLDMCTGSGIIGISVACNSLISNVILLDISEDALDVANKNIAINKVQDKCTTVLSNMFEKLYKTNNKYDIITANPPYLTKTEMEELDDFVKHEPSLALYGGQDGLDIYNELYSKAYNYLNDGGSIAVEIGYKQAIDIINIIRKYDQYTDIHVIKDINSKDRVVTCRFQSK